MAPINLLDRVLIRDAISEGEGDLGLLLRWRRRCRSAVEAPLPQREWDHANGQKHNQVKGASKKMRFDVWFSLFFHGGVEVRSRIPASPKPSQKKRLGKLRPQFTGSIETCQRYFQAIYKKIVG